MTERLRSRAGLTLIEILIVVAIFGMAAVAVAAIWLGADRSAQLGADITEAQADVREVMQEIEREIRAGSFSSFDSSLIPDELLFATYPFDSDTLTTVRYYTDLAGNLLRDEGGTTTTVAENIGSFQVVSATGQSISLQIEIVVRGISALLETDVAFRNP